ncbi:hypothetical protein IQ07DRAFT_629540 [Pyrenochaeta sp. DS3sAY3a]|nr:hypothetical protein IQ07DRAFT_629540 [Pyrenochaeta sp. DS3sAY3a]
MSDIHEFQRTKRRRSTRACQGCRLNKSKCEIEAGHQDCLRCISNAIPCRFLASRRGRVKGSKNLRTLEKLSQIRGQPSMQGRSRSPAASTDSHFTAFSRTQGERPPYPDGHVAATPPNLTSHTDVLDPLLQQRGDFGRRSGTATPWNLQHLSVEGEQQAGLDRPSLTRTLLQVLDEFPVDSSKRDEEANESKARGLQEPLWILAGLADRGWDVSEASGDQTSPSKHNGTLHRSLITAALEHMLRQWTPQALQNIRQEQARYFEHGVYASKRDVAPALDPVHCGVVTEQRAHELFEIYWQVIHPQWALLDPTLHTFSSVRQRSALLTTTMLALGATAKLATENGPCDEDITEALRLHAHVEKVNLVVYATGARSVDIVQAQILLSRWGKAPKCRMEEQRWVRAGIIPRIATEIGLTRPPKCSNQADEARSRQLLLNELRTRMFLIINEYRFSTYSGRQPVHLSQFQLSEDDLRLVTEATPGRETVTPAALYDLFLFDRETRRRIGHDDGSKRSWRLDAELEHMRAYIEDWIRKWCSESNDPAIMWYHTHEALSTWLLLVTHVAKIRLQRSEDQLQTHQQQRHQQLMSHLAVGLFSEALKVPYALRNTQRASVFPFAASILLRTNSRPDLVLPVALHMAGDPGKHQVPTFVREAGIQMLLMVDKTTPTFASDASPRNSSGDSAIIQLGNGSADEASHQTQRSLNQEPLPATDNVIETGNFQHNYPLDTGSLFQSVNPDAMFSFNAEDFPSVPDDFLIYPDSQGYVPRCQDFGDLDALIGAPNPNGIADVGDAQAQLGDLPSLVPSGTTSSYYQLMNSSQVATNTVSSTSTRWPQESLSPSSTGFGVVSQGSGGQERNAQRDFLLSAMDKLIQLASRL